jgi:hypothetical protein
VLSAGRKVHLLHSGDFISNSGLCICLIIIKCPCCYQHGRQWDVVPLTQEPSILPPNTSPRSHVLGEILPTCAIFLPSSLCALVERRYFALREDVMSFQDQFSIIGSLTSPERQCLWTDTKFKQKCCRRYRQLQINCYIHGMYWNFTSIQGSLFTM